jgi:hypothetical protein
MLPNVQKRRLPHAAAAANQFAVGRRVPGSVTPAEMAALLTV